MRVDVGLWTKKKLINEPLKSETNTPPYSSDYESHWLRFEKYLGSKMYLGTSSENRNLVLTDIDYLMSGNTFYKHDNFDFRSV